MSSIRYLIFIIFFSSLGFFCQESSIIDIPSDSKSGEKTNPNTIFELDANSSSIIYINENLSASNQTSAYFQNTSGKFTPLKNIWDTQALSGSGALSYSETTGENVNLSNDTGFAFSQNPLFAKSDSEWIDDSFSINIKINFTLQSPGDTIKLCRSSSGFCLYIEGSGTIDQPSLTISLKSSAKIAEGAKQISNENLYSHVAGSKDGIEIILNNISETVNSGFAYDTIQSLVWNSSKADTPGDMKFSVSLNETELNSLNTSLSAALENASKSGACNELSVNFKTEENFSLPAIPLHLKIGAYASAITDPTATPATKGFEIKGQTNASCSQSLCQDTAFASGVKECSIAGPFENGNSQDYIAGTGLYDSNTLSDQKTALTAYFQTADGGSLVSTQAAEKASKQAHKTVSEYFSKYWNKLFGVAAQRSAFSIVLINGAPKETSTDEDKIKLSNQNLSPSFSYIKVYK